MGHLDGKEVYGSIEVAEGFAAGSPSDPKANEHSSYLTTLPLTELCRRPWVLEGCSSNSQDLSSSNKLKDFKHMLSVSVFPRPVSLNSEKVIIEK